MKKGRLLVAITIWIALIGWSAADAFGDPSRTQAAAELYQTLTAETDWLTEDVAGNPARCRFLGTDDEAFAGIVFVSYVDYEDGAWKITRTNALWWSISGDVLDIQGNYFVLSSMGQLYRIPRPDGLETARQTVRPGSW